MSKKALAIGLWTLGILNFGTNLLPITNYEGYDTIPVWRAIHALLTHGQIYTHRGAGDFLYLPSSLVILLPLGALSLRTAKALLFVADIAAILISGAVLLRLFRFRWSGLAGGVALCGLSLASPVFVTLGAGNVDALVLLAFVAFLVAADRDSWTSAGIVLGLAIALKPVLAPLLLIVVLYRRWRALVLAVLTPCALSGIILLVAPASRAFFTAAIPQLWHGQDAQIQHASISLSSVGNRLGIPHAATDLARLAVFVGAAALVWRRRAGSAAEPHRLIELSTIVLTSAFLLSTFAFPFYGVYLLPFAVAATTRSSQLHHWLTWTALFCVAASAHWYLDRLPSRLNQLLAERVTFGFLLVLLAAYIGVRRATEARMLEDVPRERPTERRADLGAVAER